MKKIITILAILFTSVVNAQVKVKVIDATGIERWIDYVPGVTSTNIKPQLDSIRYVIQSWATGQFAAKGSTGTEGDIISLPEQKWYRQFKPFDFNTTYSDGSVQGSYSLFSYSTHQGVNTRSNRPDQVLQIAGYNSNPNNGRTNTTDASWDLSVETHFDIPTFPNAAFEFHTQRMKTTTGKEIRGLSWYVDKVTGGGFHNFVTNSINAFVPGYENNEAYFKVFDGRIELTNNTPGNSGTGLFMKNDNGQTIALHQRGGVPVFDIPTNKSMGANYNLHWDSWNGLRIVQGFYNNNSDAKTLGNLKVGDTYWTRINGIKVLAQVE